ncbi:MAG: 30S ribosomal protein S12 methylthiotransferase RimO [Pseudomonadota bacterium]
MSEKQPSVGFVSLGCPKALVDSERILTQLRAEGYAFSPQFEGADVVIVNTCGFIDEAVDESLESIGEALAKNGRVIVTGCLGAKRDVVLDEHPEVLAVTGPHAYEDVMSAVHDAVPPSHDPFQDLLPTGIKLTPRHYAYLKISEGCNHRCSFCIIPSMRGDLVSRPLESILDEAANLVDAGVKELLVISQDTSAYGVDLKYRPTFWRGRPLASRMLGLCEGLASLGAWVRLHYVYPYPHVDHVIPLMRDGLVLPYLDIPFQHGSPSVLKRMRRPAHAENTLERIGRWREMCPDLAIRSTFIVGFPGETDEEFAQLLDWLVDAQLDRVGCFQYSPVDGASANQLDDPVPDDVKQDRWDAFMQLAGELSAARLARRIGSQQIAIVDDVTADGAVGRTQGDAPEIDGVVHIESGEMLAIGDVVSVRITDSDDYDLYARCDG